MMQHCGSSPAHSGAPVPSTVPRAGHAAYIVMAIARYGALSVMAARSLLCRHEHRRGNRHGHKRRTSGSAHGPSCGNILVVAT